MQGDVLYPLNQLKDIHPEIYQQAAAKYEGRLQVMQQEIPPLHCLWNDVLHFSPIHPLDLQKALMEAGRTDFHGEYYQVDASLFDPEKTTIFIDRDMTPTGRDFVAFSSEEIEKHRQVPQMTIEYYKEVFTRGGKPLLFVGIPHILLKDSLSVKGLPIVRV